MTAKTKACKCKRCPLIGVPQPLENFSKNKRKSDGLQNFCRVCVSRDNREIRMRKMPAPKLSMEYYNETMSNIKQREIFNRVSRNLENFKCAMK